MTTLHKCTWKDFQWRRQYDQLMEVQKSARAVTHFPTARALFRSRMFTSKGESSLIPLPPVTRNASNRSHTWCMSISLPQPFDTVVQLHQLYSHPAHAAQSLRKQILQDCQINHYELSVHMLVPPLPLSSKFTLRIFNFCSVANLFSKSHLMSLACWERFTFSSSV